MTNRTYTADRIARIRGTKNPTKTAANQRQNTTETEAQHTPKPLPKRSPFAGLCCLCGLPAKRRYCHAHSWAEGT